MSSNIGWEIAAVENCSDFRTNVINMSERLTRKPVALSPWDMDGMRWPLFCLSLGVESWWERTVTASFSSGPGTERRCQMPSLWSCGCLSVSAVKNWKVVAHCAFQNEVSSKVPWGVPRKLCEHFVRALLVLPWNDPPCQSSECPLIWILDFKTDFVPFYVFLHCLPPWLFVFWGGLFNLCLNLYRVYYVTDTHPASCSVSFPLKCFVLWYDARSLLSEDTQCNFFEVLFCSNFCPHPHWSFLCPSPSTHPFLSPIFLPPSPFPTFPDFFSSFFVSSSFLYWCWDWSEGTVPPGSVTEVHPAPDCLAGFFPQCVVKYKPFCSWIESCTCVFMWPQLLGIVM